LSEALKAESITHVGIAVSDLESAIQDYCKLFQFESVERLDVGTEGVRVALLRAGQTEIELLSSAKEGTSISKFVKENGEGLHHLAIRVKDVATAIDAAKKLGLRVLDDEPRIGAKGAEAAFVHPKSFHGVLLEFYNR
jgi:methylmalonyl-CoA/ethylmalonyl-CoA epimerase